MGIDYDKLTPEEFVTQINILKKSAHLKSPNNLRGGNCAVYGAREGKSKEAEVIRVAFALDFSLCHTDSQ